MTNEEYIAQVNSLSEKYVDQVNRLMDLQNTYLSIFLTVLGLVLAFFAFLQWRLSTNQIDKIKVDIEKELNEKYNLQAIKDIEETVSVFNEALSTNMIIAIKQMLGAMGPTLNNIEQYHQLIKSLNNYGKINIHLSYFLVNTIHYIINKFKSNEEAKRSLDIDMSFGLEEKQEEIIEISEKEFEYVRSVLLETLSIIESKSSDELKLTIDIDAIKESIQSFNIDSES